MHTADDFTHDALMIRTTDAQARAHGSFVWPRKIGSIVLPEKWNPEPECGDGLHGLLDGLGNNALMARDGDALWWVVGVIRAEVIKIDDEKVKVPRAKVLYCGHMPGAYKMIVGDMHKALMAATTGNRASAATTGDYASAATTGYGASAATTGYGASAATTGNRASAATTGNRASAATTGSDAVAAALGSDATAKAGEGGAICVVRRDPRGKLLGIRATLIGQHGTAPDVFYRLNDTNEFEAV